MDLATQVFAVHLVLNSQQLFQSGGYLEGLVFAVLLFGFDILMRGWRTFKYFRQIVLTQSSAFG